MRNAVRFVVLATLGASALARSAHADPIDDIVAKNVAAHGGENKLKAVKTVRLTGKVDFGGDGFNIEADFGLLRKRGMMVRQEGTVQGMTQISAYDGKDAWRVDPFQGRRDAERMSADEAKELAEQADIDGPLIDWRAKGSRLELLGTEDIDGTDAIKVRVTRRDGDVQYVYLDPDSMLEIRITTVRKVRGVETEMDTDLGSYAQVAGVWMPTAMEVGEHGKPRFMKIMVQRAEVNVPADDSLFRFPSTPPSAAVVAGPPDKASELSYKAPPAPEGKAPVIDSTTISGLGIRNIGSATMSGRIAAIAGVNDGGKTTLYVGAASGGVWRSYDGGTTFKPVFDKQDVQSIGAIAIDPTNPKTVWVGTGEAWTRNSTSIGDGIYKTTDGGDTWTKMGLPESERIVRVLVHPKNGNVVYACVPGKLWSDSKDRGVYKTTDGGKTWTQVLSGKNLSTGCSGLAMDPRNPDVLLAGMWDFRRKGWTFRSGGDGPDSPSSSGLYKTTDGGRTWNPMTSGGLPAGPWGRVEVVYAPSNNKIVYALIESKDSALYRSADGGATWEKRDKSQMMVWRPFYFGRLVVDPTNPDRVFKPDLNLIVSEDGGSSFSQTGGSCHGDWHDLWIDPQNPKHTVGGNDGGLCLSYDGGNRWFFEENLPVSQFYHVSVDDADPYHVYGGLQDNSSWVGDSSYPGGVTNSRWENMYDGDGFWSWVDPTDPDGVYAEAQGGFVGRVDRKTHAVRDIQPKAGYHEKLRFNWNTPIAVSPNHKGTIYIGAQFLFRSSDKGMTWDRISPDLTTNDKDKQKQEESGGVTVDNSSAEMHTTIYSISESPKDGNLIWVGTDDGNVQVTRNGGKAWTNVTANVTGLPANSWVSWVEASRYDAGTAFAAFDRHTYGDMTPWVYKTTDYGKTWTRIVSPDQGVRGYAHVIKEDSENKQLLFLGTELGLWVSIDGGASWAQFKGNGFPSAVAVRDLALQARDGDLVLATHGRGIWIIDDLTPLRTLDTATLKKNTTFLPERAIQERMPAGGGWTNGDAAFVGDNAPGGATITYYLRGRHIYGDIKLEVLDPTGKVIDTVTPTKHRGINRVTWTMSVKPPAVPKAAQIAFEAAQGPRVVPGTYTVRLTNGADVVEGKLKIVLDRRAPYSVGDRKAQFDAVMKAHALFGEMTKLVDRIEAIKAAAQQKLDGLPAGDASAAKIKAVIDQLDTIKREIVATKEGGAITGEERIREHLSQVYGALMRWEGKPTKYQLDRVEVLRKELADVAKELDGVIAKAVTPLGIPTTGAVLPRELDEREKECVETRGASCHTDEVPVEND